MYVDHLQFGGNSKEPESQTSCAVLVADCGGAEYEQSSLQQSQDPKNFQEGGTPTEKSKGTTRAHLQTIHKRTGQWLDVSQHEVSDKSGRQPVTLSNSYVWPVPLPDNEKSRKHVMNRKDSKHNCSTFSYSTCKDNAAFCHESFDLSGECMESVLDSLDLGQVIFYVGPMY